MNVGGNVFRRQCLILFCYNMIIDFIDFIDCGDQCRVLQLALPPSQGTAPHHRWGNNWPFASPPESRIDSTNSSACAPLSFDNSTADEVPKFRQDNSWITQEANDDSTLHPSAKKQPRRFQMHEQIVSFDMSADDSGDESKTKPVGETTIEETFHDCEDFPTRISNAEMARLPLEELRGMCDFINLDNDGPKYTVVARLNKYFKEEEGIQSAPKKAKKDNGGYSDHRRLCTWRKRAHEGAQRFAEQHGERGGDRNLT